MSTETFEFRPSGLVEFEAIQPEVMVAEAAAAAAAAAAADDTIDMDPLSINFTRKKDHRPEAAERMLAGSTIDWLVAFPPEMRPKALCERYPHVANRLAAQWTDRPRAVESLTSLATDSRWGSAGFPGQVQDEVQRLLTAMQRVLRA